ncbi:MAG TPA: hypothetical protein VI298_06045 [Geobacteraceae bacterium]
MERLKQHYAILGIQPGASLEQVRQAYAAAETHLHAQRHSESALVRGKAQARLKVINEAYLAIVDAYEEVQASLEDQKDHLPQSRDERTGPLPGAPPPVGHNNDVRPPVGSAANPTGADRQSAMGGAPPFLPPESATEISPDPADLLRKEIFFFVAVLAVLFMVLIVRCANDRRHPPPATRADADTPAERAEQGGTPKGKPDVATVSRDAKQGNARAQALLGYFYANGIGVPENLAEAALWFGMAASQGDAEAQDWLGYLYETGQGVTRNYGEAARWYRLAAAQGNADAEKNLGLMYAKGVGVARNRQEAVKWLQKAAAQGNRDAQLALKKWQGE